MEKAQSGCVAISKGGKEKCWGKIERWLLWCAGSLLCSETSRNGVALHRCLPHLRGPSFCLLIFLYVIIIIIQVVVLRDRCSRFRCVISGVTSETRCTVIRVSCQHLSLLDVQHLVSRGVRSAPA